MNSRELMELAVAPFRSRTDFILGLRAATDLILSYIDKGRRQLGDAYPPLFRSIRKRRKK